MMNNLSKLKLFSLLFIGFAFGQVIKAPEVTIPRIKGPIRIDGYLDEAVWQDAVKIDKFREWAITNGADADVKTEVLIGYDDEHLYFGFICYEDNMSELRARRVEPHKSYLIVSQGYDADDLTDIHINTFINSEEGYAFLSNPLGIKYQFYCWGSGVSERADSYTENIDLIWYSGGRILDSCWILEIAIPFKSLRFPSAENHVWRVNFVRWRARQGILKLYSWSPCPWGVFSVYSFMGRMYINERISVTRKFEFLPYLTGGINKLVEEKPIFPKRFGVSGKYYLTYDNVLDWTILPDYSQIESDAPQIDVNTTFALYYPEKRPFFMERKSFFETPTEIFYTRTINDPLVALKFAGGTAGFNFGYISAYDQHTPWVIPFSEKSRYISSDERSISNILRIKKDLLNSSYLGLISTNRDLIANGFNRVVGLDGAFYFLNNYALSYQGLISWTQEPNDSAIYAGSSELNFKDYTSRFDGEEFWGKGFYLGLTHKSEYLNINALYKGLSPEFRADNGFIQYNDFESRSIFTSLRFRINRFCFKTILPKFGIAQERRFFGKQKEFEKSASLSIQFTYPINTTFTYRTVDKEYQDILFNGIWNYDGNISVSPIKYFSSGIYCPYGRQINYYASPPSLGYRLSPSVWFEISIAKLRMKLSYLRYLFWQTDFNLRIYDTEIFEDEINWSFTKNLNFRILLQYSSSARNLFISPLLSFLPTPFTVFYLGSNHSLERPIDSQILNDFELTESKIFIKLQYLFKY